MLQPSTRGAAPRHRASGNRCAFRERVSRPRGSSIHPLPERDRTVLTRAAGKTAIDRRGRVSRFRARAPSRRDGSSRRSAPSCRCCAARVERRAADSLPTLLFRSVRCRESFQGRLERSFGRRERPEREARRRSPQSSRSRRRESLCRRRSPIVSFPPRSACGKSSSSARTRRGRRCRRVGHGPSSDDSRRQEWP